ncbi:MAG: type 1 glutamine amidotransferase [Oscillibacter sp.]|nr:type 1 glutamine amidotransferase [Oscillibacter sp.]
MVPAVWIIGDRARFPNYWRAVERAGGRPRCEGVPEDCAALLLPGGGDMEPWRYGQENAASRNLDPARDALELDLLERFAALKKPVLGICRGMQSVNVFFGGTLLQDIPGHEQINGVDRMHPVRTAPGAFVAADAVNSAHHQAVDRLGAGLRAEQWVPDGVIEAIRHTRLPVWGVQWHPERLDNPAGERLFRAFLGLCGA